MAINETQQGRRRTASAMMPADQLAEVEADLRRCEMPEHEIRWILETDQWAIAHMLLELHVERLGEAFAERCAAIRELDALLMTLV